MLNYSVIIPTGPGHEDLFVNAVRSVQLQHGVTFEIIVVNDTGKELTLQDNSHVKLIDTDARNVSVARNLGAKESHGCECLIFLDADDMLVPGALLALWTIYQEEKTVIYGNVIRGDNGMLHESPEQDCSSVRTSAFYKPKRMPTHLIPRKIFLKSKGFDSDLEYFEDVDFECYLDFKLEVCAIKINYPIYFYNMQNGLRRSYTEKDNKKTLEVKKKIYNKYEEYLKGEEKMGCGCEETIVNTNRPQVKGAGNAPNINQMLAEMESSDLYLVYVGNETARMYPGRQTNKVYRFGRTGSHKAHRIGYNYNPNDLYDLNNEVDPQDAHLFATESIDRSGINFKIERRERKVIPYNVPDIQNEIFTEETVFEETVEDLGEQVSGFEESDVPFEVTVGLGMHASKLTIDEVRNLLEYATPDVVAIWLDQERKDKNRSTLIPLLESHLKND